MFRPRTCLYALCLTLVITTIATAQKARIDFLLSGHSLTDEPIGQMVHDIATSRGHEVGWQRQNGIGSPIFTRTLGHRGDPRDPVGQPWTGYASARGRDGEAIDLVRELRRPATIGGETYTHLVVAERHDSLSVVQWENTVPLLRHFYELAREGSPDVKGYFFTTWADVAGVGSSKADPAGWVRYERAQLRFWEAVVSRINDSLAREKRPDRLATLPASGALAELVHRATTGKVKGVTGGTVRQTMDALFSDDVHQTMLGRYYVACVTYACITRQSPVGATHPPEVSREAAASLQAIAWEYVSDYYRGKPQGPHHDFAARAESARAFVPMFWAYRGRPEQSEQSVRFFTRATLENPLWTSTNVDESQYWFPRLP
ncbi:MAG TPA: hypothetical protein VGN72_19365 [Tepidisphaeraceae bacterium]|jgi:hypothetical protein|nr:hypothetical protein [Tepidisphaeraceae bacterium]